MSNTPEPTSPISLARITQLTLDMLAAELTETRGRSAMELGAGTWSRDTILDEEGLHLDSLERLNASGALNAFFHLHEYGAEDYLLAMRSVGEWSDLIEQSLAETGTHLTFQTSGSTGTPKPCTHEMAALMEEAACWTQIVGTPSRVISLVPSHHIYGTIWSILLPQLLDVPCDYRQLRPSSALNAAKDAADGETMLVIGTPTMWEFLAKALPAIPPAIVGISSTAPMPAELAERLAVKGLSRLIEIYGSSETGGIGWRDSYGAPYQLLDYWSRSGDGSISREVGEGAPQEIAIMDDVVWTDDRHLTVTGRHDGAVQVGGHNVFPEQVRKALIGHPDIADAAVRLDTQSSRLKAFLVPAEVPSDQASFIEGVERWSAEQFSAAERPRAFTLGTDLPRNAMGKLTDW